MEDFESERCARLRALLQRVTLEMADCALDTVKASLAEYVGSVVEPASSSVEIKAKDDVTVLPKGYSPPADPADDTEAAAANGAAPHPPAALLGLRLVRSREEQCLNQGEVDARVAEMSKWHADREAKKKAGKPVNDKEPCPFDPVPPVMGHVFEYTTAPASFAAAVLAKFNDAVEAVQGMYQPQRFVMQRLFFPHPKLVSVPGPDTEWVQELRAELAAALDRALQPPAQLLEKLAEWQDFLNLDEDAYAAGLSFKPGDDDDDGGGDDGDGPDVPRVDIKKLSALLAEHSSKREAILRELPSAVQGNIHLGLWAVDATPLRSYLAAKHQRIIDLLLARHAQTTAALALAIDQQYLSIEARLGEDPVNVEKTAALEEYILKVGDQTKPLEELLKECDEYAEKVLFKYMYTSDEEQSHARFTAQGWPWKIKARIESASLRCERCREAFAEELATAQEGFVRTLLNIEQDVANFGAFDSLDQVGLRARGGCARGGVGSSGLA